jgi:hypothetical protein
MPKLIPKDFGSVKDCKVILLSNENFNVLHGYKAEVTKKLSVLPDKLKYRNAFVMITITGLSNKGAKELYNSLMELPEKEISEMLKDKGFHFSNSNMSDVPKET